MVQDSLGNIQESPKGTIEVFAPHVGEKYAHIVVDARCIEVIVEAFRPNNTGIYAEPLKQPITPEEIHIPLRKGCNKAPVSDGIGLEFYTNWEVI
jgi:hypothetical protein